MRTGRPLRGGQICGLSTEVVRFYLGLGMGFLLSTLAAREGLLEVLQQLLACGCPWYGPAHVEAAGGGHLGVLRWVHAQGYQVDADWVVWGYMAAARGGRMRPEEVRLEGPTGPDPAHLAVLQWGHAVQGPWVGITYEMIWRTADRYGRTDISAWARQMFQKCSAAASLAQN
jgi:hypothetical protein